MTATIRYVSAPCALGHVLLAAGDLGICHLRLGDDPGRLEESFLRAFPETRPAPSHDPVHEWCRRVVAHLARGEASGQPPEFPLELRGSPFQQRVWRALCSIPDGEVRTYGEVARSLALPGGARAVAGACARNPVAVLVPCHRVVPASGGIGGYRWGPWRKRALLEGERAAVGEEPTLPEARVVSSG